MKNISLKIDSDIFDNTEKILSNIKISRNRYINEAIDYYNKIQQTKLLKRRLKEESEMVREESMRVLSEFENLEYED
jgi:hypothetical protein